MNILSIFDQKFFRFILVGIINTIAGATIMFSLYNAAHLNYWISSASSYLFSSILSFFLNKYFTFSVRQWSVFMIVAFICNIAVSYCIAYGIAKPTVNYLLMSKPQKIRENVALFTGMCLFTGINYLGQKLIVFKEKNNETN